MIDNKLKMLGISGSLRANSSATSVLKQVIALAPGTIEFRIYEGLGKLPHFDDSENISPEVEAFRTLITEADGVLICTPEYAFGVPGSLKNALDWTVGSGEFVNKPVALITASSAGDKAHASLLLTLSAITAKVAEGSALHISFIRSKLNAAGEVTDAATLESLRSVLHNFIQSVQAEKNSNTEG